MHQAATQPQAKDDRTLDAIDRLAEIAKSVNLEREHDAKMLTVANSAVTAVRQVLEADAIRARRLGWMMGGAGTAIALVVIGLSLWAAREARQTEREYQSRLLEESSKRIALENEIALHKTTADVLRSARQQDRDSLAKTRSELSESRRQLKGTMAELGSLQSNRQNVVEVERLISKFATRTEHEELRGFLHIVVGQLLAERNQLNTAAGDPPGAQAAKSHIAHDAPAVLKVMTLTDAEVNVHDSPPPFDSLSCDEATHECYLTPSRACRGS
jgi:hypothetical protein